MPFNCLKISTLKKSPLSIALLPFLLGLTACSTLTPLSHPNKVTPTPLNANKTLNVVENSQPDFNQTDFSQKVANARHEYTLDNGLRVIIKEDHRSPVVMSQIWYKVGSDDEPQNLGGISHLLEHMMFKGTKTVSSADFERIVSKFGGSNNAFTTHDYTGYYEIFPANRLGLALELEADRMTNLQLQATDFTQERQVVMEERRQRTDDNPNARAYEQFSKMAFPTSPKGKSVIGPMTEIEAITLPDLAKWYQAWYRPNNATLVIVGDISPDTALAEVKRYFGAKQAIATPARQSVRQAGFRGYQEHVAKLPVQVPSVMIAFNVPTLTTADNPKTAHTLSLLAEVLDGGLSARLEKHLVREKQILASVGSGYNSFDRGDGLFMVHATPRAGVSLELARQAVLDEIDALKTQPILASELTRAKTNTITGLIYGQDSLSGQAQIIGSLASIGLDDRMIYDLPKIFDTINEQDLHAVASKYLVKDNLTVLNVISDGASKNSHDTSVKK